MVLATGSTGMYFLEPLALVEKAGTVTCFSRITEEKAHTVTTQVLKDGTAEGLAEDGSAPLWSSQNRRLLKNAGYVDPLDLLSAVGRGAYSALNQALTQEPSTVTDAIAKSGLRGCGGAGFPTVEKLKVVNDQPGQKTVVVNAMQIGNPSPTAFLLQSNPHMVLEGMLLAAYACHAESGILCLDESSTQVQKTVSQAIKQMEQYGLLGNEILDSNFAFTVRIATLPGGLHSGEESALLDMLETGRGISNSRPPYPAQSGLNGAPTLVLSAETLANLPGAILGESADTKLVTIQGTAGRSLTAEVSLGTPVRELVTQLGGADESTLKAVQVGGPTGGFLLPSELDTAYDYDTLPAVGAMVGNSTVEVLDSSCCIVAHTRDDMQIAMSASCGKCVMCRNGTSQMHYILNDITNGNGKAEDCNLLQEIASHVKQYANCGLGKSAANPVLTSLEKFADEYSQHISRHRCEALACNKLVLFYIDGEQCKGCGQCATTCSEQAIAGGEGLIHVIDQQKCSKCGRCLAACPNGAVEKATGILPKVPVHPMPVGTFKKRGGLMRRRLKNS